MTGDMIRRLAEAAERAREYETVSGRVELLRRERAEAELAHATAAARVADRRLAVLRTALADLAGVWLAPDQELGELTRFADIFLDTVFTDIAVRGRIQRAEEAVDRAMTSVARLYDRLGGEAGEIRRHLAALAAERVALLTAP